MFQVVSSYFDCISLFKASTSRPDSMKKPHILEIRGNKKDNLTAIRKLKEHIKTNLQEGKTLNVITT